MPFLINTDKFTKASIAHTCLQLSDSPALYCFCTSACRVLCLTSFTGRVLCEPLCIYSALWILRSFSIGLIFTNLCVEPNSLAQSLTWSSTQWISVDTDPGHLHSMGTRLEWTAPFTMKGRHDYSHSWVARSCDWDTIIQLVAGSKRGGLGGKWVTHNLACLLHGSL